MAGLGRRASSLDPGRPRGSRHAPQSQGQQNEGNRETVGNVQKRLRQSKESSSRRAELELIQKSRAADALYESSDGEDKGLEPAGAHSSLIDEGNHSSSRPILKSIARGPAPNAAKIQPRLPEEDPIAAAKKPTAAAGVSEKAKAPSNRYASMQG